MESSRKRKRAANPDVSAEDDRSRWKKLRKTKARQQPAIPRRENPLIEHVDPDTRRRIYAHLVFDPMERLYRTPVGVDGHAFAKTCRQARKELRKETDHQLRAFIKHASDVYMQQTGSTIRLSKALAEKDSLTGVKDLTLICTGNIPQLAPLDELASLDELEPLDGRMPKPFNRLLRLHLRSLRLHFVGNPKKDESANIEALLTFMNNALACIVEDNLSDMGPHEPDSEILIRCLTISWDFRSNPPEPVTVAGKRIGNERYVHRQQQIAQSQRLLAAIRAEHNNDRNVGTAFADVGRFCELRTARWLLKYHLLDAIRDDGSVAGTHVAGGSCVVTDTEGEFDTIE